MQIISPERDLPEVKTILSATELTDFVVEGAHDHWLAQQSKAKSRILWYKRMPLANNKSGHPWLVPYDVLQQIARDDGFSLGDLLKVLEPYYSLFPNLYSSENLNLLSTLTRDQWLEMLVSMETDGINANEKWRLYAQYFLQLAGVDVSESYDLTEIYAHKDDLLEIVDQLIEVTKIPNIALFAKQVKLPEFKESYQLMLLAHHNWRKEKYALDSWDSLTSITDLAVNENVVKYWKGKIFDQVAEGISVLTKFDPFNPSEEVTENQIADKINAIIEANRREIDSNESINAATSWDIILAVIQTLSSYSERFAASQPSTARIRNALITAANGLLNNLKYDANPTIGTILIDVSTEPYSV